MRLQSLWWIIYSPASFHSYCLSELYVELMWIIIFPSVATNMCEIRNGGCEHICEPQGLSGRYRCRCDPGYILNPNMRSCDGKTQPTTIPLSTLVLFLYRFSAKNANHVLFLYCWLLYYFIQELIFCDWSENTDKSRMSS